MVPSKGRRMNEDMTYTEFLRVLNDDVVVVIVSFARVKGY